MNIETVALNTLTPHPANARRGDVNAIAESIAANGQYKPLVVQRSTGRVLAGNHTLAALRGLGRDEAPVVYLDIDDDAALRVLLADNRTSDLATYDDAALLDLLRNLNDPTGTGYDQTAIDQLIADAAPLGGGAGGSDDAPEPPEVAKSQVGEVYDLGPHRLICGDATDRDVIALLMGDDRADCVFTDPPYAIYGSSSGLSASVTDDKIVRPFFRDALLQAQRFSRLFAQVYVCCDWRSWPSWWEVARATGLDPKNLLVWDKGSSGLGNNWANTYELIGYFTHMPEQKTMTGDRQTGQRPVLSPNVIRANRVTGAERQHNAAKPVDLIDHVLGLATDAGDIVLDLFGGSGSTLIAADTLGLNARLIDIDPAYCDVIRQRYANHANRPDLAP